MEIVGNIYKGNKQAGRIYSKDGICPALSAMEGGNTEPKIIEIDTPMKGNYTESNIIDNYNQRIPENQDVIGTITTNVGNSAPRNGFKVAEPIILDDTMGYEEEIREYRDYSPALRSERNGLKVAEPLRIPQATKQGYIEVPQGAVFDMSYPESTTRRGRVQEGGQVSPTLMAGGEAPCYFEGVEAKVFKEGNYHKSGHNANSIVNPKGLSPTVMENHGTVTATIEPMSYRIRKLTPRECFRLMGVTEDDIDKIQQSGVSNSQQYKMAGNSIVVDVMYYIFKNMFAEEKGNTTNNSGQLSLF